MTESKNNTTPYLEFFFFTELEIFPRFSWFLFVMLLIITFGTTHVMRNSTKVLTIFNSIPSLNLPVQSLQ